MTIKTREALATLKKELDPQVFTAVTNAIGAIPGGGLVANDNQNQNQNGKEQLRALKPEVLAAVMSFRLPGDELSSNQNQNQNGGLAELALEKPDIILNLHSKI